jgi:hypothetical protein
VFVAETVKSKLDIDPVTGEEVEKIGAGPFKPDAATVARMSVFLQQFITELWRKKPQRFKSAQCSLAPQAPRG